MSGNNGSRGIRYTPEQKQEVLDWIKANPGRGNLKQASEKYGVSYVALRNWMSDAGVGSEKTAKEIKSSKSDSVRFEKAKKLIDRIQETEQELRVLYAELHGLIQP